MVSITATLLDMARFCSMHILVLYSDILYPGGQLEAPGLVIVKVVKVVKTFNLGHSS